MATYNGEKFIYEQVESILAQIGEEDELIVSDDASSDNTIGIIRSFGDNRIKVFTGVFHSPIKNFENAIKHAQGDVIFLSDQDDVWVEHKVNTILPYLEKYLLVFSNAIVVDKDLKVVREKLYENKPRFDILGTLVRNSFVGCTMAFRKEAIRYFWPFPNKIPMHDIWIALVSLLFGKVFYIEDGLILYRRHGENLTDDKISTLPFGYRIRYRFYLIWQLIIRFFKVRLSAHR